jgi:hypothetical protein
MEQIILKHPSYKHLPKKRLYDVVRLKNPKITMKDVEKYLEGGKQQQLEEVFKKVSKPKFLKITSLPRTFQIDVVMMPKYSKYNKGIKSFLLIVDVMSRKAFAYCLLNEKMNEVVKFFKEFINNVKEVRAVTGDNFFESKEFKEVCKTKHIELYTGIAKDDHMTYGNRLGIIDRLTRTLKNMINRRMVSDEDVRWTSWLSEIIELYNELPHRSLDKQSPDEVWGNRIAQIKKHSEETIYNNELFNKCNLKEGDIVRTHKGKKNFDKEGMTFSKETHEIKERVGYKFKVKGLGKSLKPHELLKVVKALNKIRTNKLDIVEKEHNIKRKIGKEGISADKNILDKKVKGRKTLYPKPRPAIGVDSHLDGFV